MLEIIKKAVRQFRDEKRENEPKYKCEDTELYTFLTKVTIDFIRSSRSNQVGNIYDNMDETALVAKYKSLLLYYTYIHTAQELDDYKNFKINYSDFWIDKFVKEDITDEEFVNMIVYDFYTDVIMDS